VREHASELVVAAHCERHACTSAPRPRHLGDGCYTVHDPDGDHLYDCSTDRLPAGAASCIEVTPCIGACTQTITINNRQIPIDRCVATWRADREAHRPPRTCSPARLQVVIEPAATPAVTPSTLVLPAELVVEVIRSGKDRVVYAAESCVASDGIVVKEPTHRTGFADLDRVLHRQIGELAGASSPGACVIVTLLVSHFECESDKVLL